MGDLRHEHARYHPFCEERLEIANPTGGALSSAAPTMSLLDPLAPGGTSHHLTPQDVAVEVRDGAGWRTLPTGFDCNHEVEVDTSSLQAPLTAGGKARYTFRVGLVKGWNYGVAYTLGAVGDGHRSAPLPFNPPAYVLMEDLKPMVH